MRGQEITFYERQKIELHLRGKESVRGIGRMLHRDHSVIVRELERNTCRDGTYRAAKAEEYAKKKKRQTTETKVRDRRGAQALCGETNDRQTAESGTNIRRNQKAP